MRIQLIPSLALFALVCLAPTSSAGGTIVWTDLGQGLAGGQGVPQLVMTGSLTEKDPAIATVTNLPPDRRTFLFMSPVAGNQPFMGGVLVPDTSTPIAFPSFDGELVLQLTVLVDLPVGSEFFFQVWVHDPQAPEGAAASNAYKASA